MTIADSTREHASRKTCQHCQRPLAVCYCTTLVNINNRIKVTIVLHPQEQKHPFNTGRIANLCLSNSEIIVAETFPKQSLEKLLSTPSALLYPSLPWLPEVEEICTTQSNQKISQQDIQQNTQNIIRQLIVIDATWRKSKKMLHLNPLLQTLPRINLTGGLKSNYQIRKTSMENGLSTLESIVDAMQILEPENSFSEMLKPFEKMIALQQDYERENIS